MGTAIKLDDTPVNLYDQDFYVWTMEQADLLRRCKRNWMDLEHVAEELESMSKWDRRKSSVAWKNCICTLPDGSGSRKSVRRAGPRPSKSNENR